MKRIIFGLTLAAGFLGLRWYQLPQRLNFSMDQGEFMIRAREIWINKEITLIGPTASPKVDGRQFFQGPLIYYALGKMGWLSRWDPLLISRMMAVLALIGAGLLWWALYKISGEEAAWYGAILFTILPVMVQYSNFIWNPNFLMLLTPLFLAMMANSWWLMAGIAAGIGLQFHFQFLLIIAGAIILLILKKKNIWWIILGTAIGYSPLIIFDLRHQFYNSGTFFKWILSGQSGIGMPIHYWLAVIIVGIFMVAIILSRPKNKKTSTAIVAAVAAISIFMVISDKSTLGMPENFRYPDLLKAEKIILNDKSPDFNMANLLTGDTRFYSLRYLLIKDGTVPMAVDKYPESKVIYVVAENGPEKFLTNPVWELSGLTTNNKIQVQKINDQVKIYKISR